MRSDSDMYTLGYRFRPWTDPQAIADGPSILRYIRDTAEEAGIVPKIRFGHAFAGPSGRAPTLAGQCTPSAPPTARRCSWRARFLYVCSGYYSYAEGHRPEFAGEADFRGPIVSPQFWPEDLDVAGKNVVVIGSGATAVTLVPALAATAAHVTMLQRSPTYVVTRPARDRIAHVLLRVLPPRVAYAIARWKNVLIGTFYYRLARRRPTAVKERIVAMAAAQVGPDCDAHTHFSPRYNPWDQRVCLVPDGDLFRSIRAGRAAVVTDTIDRFTADGIRLASGTTLPADVVVVATGLKLNLLGDIALTIDGAPCRPSEAMAYKGMMLSDVPNLALCFGYTNASWTLKADLTSGYVCRLLRHMDRRGATIVVAAPRPDGRHASRSSASRRATCSARSTGLPKQGTRKPWQVRQSYLADMLDDPLQPHRRRRAALRRGRHAAVKLRGRVAVVTGAGGGIGRAIALALARRGCQLTLVDIDADGLAGTAREAEALGVRAARNRMDVTDRAAVAALPDAVRAAHGRVDLLVNNAGVAVGGTFEQVGEDDFDWLMAINFDAVVRMTRAFLPLLQTSDDARIVNVSSIYGIVSPAGQTAYSASKFAVRGFSNALRHELEGTRVGVTVVHPGGVATAIARSARAPAGIAAAEVERRRAAVERKLRMPPARAGEIIVRGIERRRARVLVGGDAVVVALLERLAPVGYWRVLRKLVGD